VLLTDKKAQIPVKSDY